MSAKRRKAETAPLDFEKAMAELEQTVRLLEGGDLAIEDSLAAFERGVGLVKALHARLDAVQSRIEELTETREGVVSSSPMASPASGAGDEDEEGER